MAKWYDPFLTKDDSHAQIGQKGIRARKRAKEMKVNLEKKVVQTTGETTKRSERNDLRRVNNAQQKGTVITQRVVQRTPRQDTRARIAEAIQRTPSQSSQNQSVRHYRTKNGWGGVMYRNDTLKNSDKQKKR